MSTLEHIVAGDNMKAEAAPALAAPEPEAEPETPETPEPKAPEDNIITPSRQWVRDLRIGAG